MTDEEQKLRPIGTRFKMAVRPDRSTSNAYWSVIEYEVVAHSLTAREKHAPPVLAETVLPIDIKRVPVTAIQFEPDGSYKWVTPQEVINLITENAG